LSFEVLKAVSCLKCRNRCPSRERTLSEYRALLKQAGFRLDKSTPIRPPMAVIEAVAA